MTTGGVLCAVVAAGASSSDRKVEELQRDFGEPLLTVGEVATMMRVSNMTVYRLIKSGQLSAIRVGKNYRLRGRDVEHYLTERSVNLPVTP